MSSPPDDVSGPVLTVLPRRARYRVGDSVTLTCSARVGTLSNSFVWETRLPGGHFQPVTEIRDVTCNPEVSLLVCFIA